MIEQKTPDCALGLTTEILSAWRDGDLRSEEMQWIREHTVTCAACQQCLAGFVTVARALGRQRELEPGDRVWNGVQERIASRTHGRSARMRVPAWNWRGIGAVASVIIVVGLLAYVFSAVGAQRRGPAAASTATVAMTSTPAVATTPTLTSSTTVTGPQLSWQRVSSPSGATNLSTFSTAVAPNDGDVAYICVAPALGQTNAHTYVTRDRGREWVRGGDLPVGAQPPSTGKPFMLECSMGVDATRPDTAV
ncbi:MAG TPA: zf-HC2 domain-containing protein, partial [Ktedonobacterales bacterium]|nr:zf-HC2 domain-containing protein [Ktedonobacterales bacterium]